MYSGWPLRAAGGHGTKQEGLVACGLLRQQVLHSTALALQVCGEEAEAAHTDAEQRQPRRCRGAY